MAELSTDSLQSQKSLTESVNDEIKNNEQIVTEIATDFSKFLNFNVVKEESKFNDSIEMMLTKLDEYFSLVDMIRSDTSLCLSTTLPQIQEKCVEMEAVFERIDKLEAFVNMVRECVAATEEKVTKAENDLTTVGGLVKKLTSFVSLKKPPAQAKPKKPEFIPANIFSTQEFFPHPTAEDKQQGTSLSEELKQGTPLSEELKQGIPLSEELKQGTSLSDELKQRTPLSEELKQGTPLSEELKQGTSLSEELKQGTSLSEDLPIADPQT
ncbi:uncharacterized protein LOC131957451 isoform X2 [Physella acuta]|uniref:uncharacterized protein LOC131957451 isoform X2 n=1 Tax=Physella acuta TaxID=109671 RepID=UPI0027DD3048|nr:uncharacterized protein LOC131957451 isoform X2 [Physella acuta]